MRDLHRALSDISLIRAQLAQATEFRGYGPTTLAATGAVALAAAAAQALWLPDPGAHTQQYLSLWVSTAAVCFALIVIEAMTRSRRIHGSLAVSMMQSAVAQFVPALVAGALLTVVMQQVAQQSLWLLPGLWQILFSLGVFASCRVLPRPILLAGVWYLACGLGCLMLAGPGRSFSPWAMGIPFGAGQLLVAGVLQIDGRQATDEQL